MFFDREKSRSPKIQLIQTFAKRLGLLNLDISIRVIRWRRRNLVNSNERLCESRSARAEKREGEVSLSGNLWENVWFGNKAIGSWLNTKRYESNLLSFPTRRERETFSFVSREMRR